MAKSKIDIIYDMVNLAYDVKRQWSKDKDSYWLGDYARAVIKAKDEKVYDKFVDLAIQLETEGWDEFVDACKYLIDEYNQIEESKESMKESINGDCYIYFDDDGEIYGKKRRWVFCDNVKGITNTRDFFPLNDFIIDAIHIFKNEKQAQKFIDVDCKYFEDKNKLVIAEYPQTVSGFFKSKESETKSLKENRFDDLKRDIETLLLDDKVLKSLKGIDDNLELAYMLAERLDPSDYSMNDEDDLANEIKDMLIRGKIKITESKHIKESSDVVNTIASEIDKSYWIDKLIDDLDRHYESMEKAWLKNLDKLSDEDILGIVDDCMGKSKTLVGKSEMLKNKMIDDLSKAYDDYIDDIDRQIRIGKSEDEVKEMIETTLENDIKMYLKLAYNNKASSNYFMVKFAEDNLI